MRTFSAFGLSVHPRVIVLLVASLTDGSQAAVVTLKSGAQYEGSVTRQSSAAENPLAPSTSLERKPVVVIDDELRFTFVPFHQTKGFVETPPKNVERIKIQQLIATAGRKMGGVGDYLSITPFDEWGRRTYSMREGSGSTLHVHQGITEITPGYTKIEGLGSVSNPVVWDLRVATSSIPPATLRNVLLHAEGADAKNADARLRVVRLFIQAEMYREALAELALILDDFPDLEHLKEQQARLVQLLAQQVLKDIELRREAGQHLRVMALLGNFPDKDVAGETLLRVREMLQEYDEKKQLYDRAGELLEQHLRELKDAATMDKLSPIVGEIKRELNIHSLDRMADYLRLADDDKLAVDQKLALAISGWLLGSGAGIDNLTMASSLFEVRNLIVKYLQSDLIHEREEIRDKIKTLEAGSPSYVAKLIAHMKPPLATQVEEAEVPGLYELKVAGIEDQPEFTYLLQLPPEYDPSRPYPCIVTLNGGGSTELQQIAWWGGDYMEKVRMRAGQASRRGYIVIAPRWQRPLQGEYEYSRREHAAVLFTLRDALRRTSIDPDRIFLQGHFAGGDAAWDIALAHPDLWAGCVMMAPRPDRYVKFYYENARYVPLYIINGEKDVGTPAEGNWILENASELDRYLTDERTDCTVVLYRGRGRDREGFADEIQRIFDWMELPEHRRNPAPTKIKMVSMRPWDNFFWWLEVEDFPASSMVLPQAWPQSGARVAKTEAELIAKTDRIQVDPSSDRGAVWLSPDLVDFSRAVQVAVKGRELKEEVKPSIDVILEDVRTRGDRQHPFWAQLEWPERRKK